MSIRTYLGKPSLKSKEWIKTTLLQLTLIDGQRKFIKYKDSELTLTKIQEIDDSITKSNLKSIDNIPLSDTMTIGDFAFEGCSELISVTMPSSITSIGTIAFYECTSLMNIVIPMNVMNIGDAAFYACKSLTSVTLLSNVQHIGVGTFADCDQLVSIQIPSSLIRLETYMFRNCSKLTSIIIPQSIMSIGFGAFEGCSGLTQAKFEGKTMSQIKSMSYYSNWGLNEDIIIPGLVELKLSSSDLEKGSVEGSGVYENGSIVTIKAIPKDGYMFESWSDGSIDAERTLTLNSDVSLSAAFKIAIPDDMLTFAASEDGSSITLNAIRSPDPVRLEYYNGSWKDYVIGTKIEIPNGSFICMRAKDENATFSNSSTDYYKFSMTGKIAASGNIQYLLKKDGSRIDAPNHCYYDMFSGCKSLTTAPELPATTLDYECYYCMFYGCTSLIAAPELPATTFAIACYYHMFSGCTNVNDIYIPNLTELEYINEKYVKYPGDLGREGQATFHYKDI